MLTSILNGFIEQVKEKYAEWEKKLAESGDYTVIEKELAGMFNGLGASLLQPLLAKQLADPEFLDKLRVLGGRLGMRFKEYRTITVQVYQGQTIAITSPYFHRVQRKGRRRRRHGGYGAHLGLAVLGFIARGSGNLVSEVVKLALLCPSFEVAQTVLAERGMVLDVKTLRRYCAALGGVGLAVRGKVSLSGGEALAGHTLVIEIDGGRLRERVPRCGRKKKGQKRKGFTVEWKEPKLFTIYLLDKEGKVVREFAPLHDATMGDDDAAFALLERYLVELDLASVARMVFCGDGAPWIWLRVEALCAKLTAHVPVDSLYQVIDYTHAKQNLLEIVDLLPATADRDKVYQQWKDLLWHGDMAGLGRAIAVALKGKARPCGLKKLANYFEKNQHRMQYERFKAKHIPCGSGCVESAIRRVINLRLKSAGSFWTRAMAEYFLFLRSQLLSGRWQIFMSNVVRRLDRFTDVLCESRAAESEVKAA